MKQLFLKLGLALLCAGGLPTCLFAAEAAPDAKANSGISKQTMDTSVRIQDDFYAHLNGAWLKNTAIPADKSMWGAVVILDDHIQPQLRAVIESKTKSQHTTGDRDAQKISDMYASFMDTATINTLGVKPLEPIFNKIDALSDKAQLPAMIAYLNRMGIVAPYNFSIGQDAKDSTTYAVNVEQGGLSLPDRDYYLNDDDAKMKAVREAYVHHVEKMLSMTGDTNAAANAQIILQLETAIAHVQWTKVELRDPIKTYNRIELTQLDKLTPGFDFHAYLQAVGLDGKITYLIAGEPSYFNSLAKLVQDTPLDNWKIYFKWHTLSTFASALPANFADENFSFAGTTLQGIPTQKERWQRAVDRVNMTLGEALGKLYVATYFPPEYKARMEKLVSNLMAAYKKSINSLDWMSTATKKQAQLKLANMAIKIGYPDKWRDYSALVIKKDDLIGNLMRANEFEVQFDINRLGHPIDRAEWGMTPQTVNAQYDPLFNDITFPAAFLQPPFFNPNADDAVNYGAIGSVIGHEISHGFDDEGSQYDENGNLRNWWTEQDHKKFAAKTAALVKQYNAFSPMSGYTVNGELTLGENIADNSGLAIALKAYKISLDGKPAPIIDGYTAEQRFFMGFGQAWLMKIRDELTLVLITTDPHSPEQFRVNGTVQNQAEFYSAFNVKKSDKMYVAPKDRVVIW